MYGLDSLGPLKPSRGPPKDLVTNHKGRIGVGPLLLKAYELLYCPI